MATIEADPPDLAAILLQDRIATAELKTVEKFSHLTAAVRVVAVLLCSLRLNRDEQQLLPFRACEGSREALKVTLCCQERPLIACLYPGWTCNGYRLGLPFLVALGKA